jgi:hypothetical protein
MTVRGLGPAPVQQPQLWAGTQLHRLGSMALGGAARHPAAASSTWLQCCRPSAWCGSLLPADGGDSGTGSGLESLRARGAPTPHLPLFLLPALRSPWQGCSLYKACNATTRPNVGSDPTVCEPFQQLATICSRDPGMGGMSGCRAHYNTMCANGSVVPQCRAMKGFSLMSTEDANKWVSARGGRSGRTAAKLACSKGQRRSSPRRRCGRVRRVGERGEGLASLALDLPLPWRAAGAQHL